MCAKYDFDDESSGNSSENIKLEPPCMVRMKIDGIFSSKSKYGQSLGVSLTESKLVDGILARGSEEDDFEQGEDNDGTLKVLSWDAEMSVPNVGDGAIDELPDVVQRNYVGNSYMYEVLDARLEGDEDEDYGDQPEEEIELGDFVFFTGATKNGPKSASKTLAKILASQGRDAVVNDESQDEWLDDDVALREDLMGREVILAMTTKKSDDTGRTFHHPYVLDGKTRAPIFVNNDASESSDEDETEEEDEEEEEENDKPDDLQSLYDTCSDLNINSEEAVVGLLEDLLEDGDISEESVEEYGREQIISDLT